MHCHLPPACRCLHSIYPSQHLKPVSILFPTTSQACTCFSSSCVLKPAYCTRLRNTPVQALFGTDFCHTCMGGGGWVNLPVMLGSYCWREAYSLSEALPMLDMPWHSEAGNMVVDSNLWVRSRGSLKSCRHPTQPHPSPSCQSLRRQQLPLEGWMKKLKHKNTAGLA